MKNKKRAPSHRLMDDVALRHLQRRTFSYFFKEMNPANGLVPDGTRPHTPASTAVIGMALATYLVAVERRWLSRADAVQRTLVTLRTFWTSPQGENSDVGYKGFYYHFLDKSTGRRAWNSELSTIDTAFLIAGALACGMYFDRNTGGEREIRHLADQLYRRVDWRWALNGGATLSMGWKPESGFLPYRWRGYCEALLLYVLALGSPSHPVPKNSYSAWAKTYQWKKLYGFEFLYGGPLFIHQLSHLWIDFRGIQDTYMRRKGIDYFENSRRATYVQREYAIRNPRKFDGYNDGCWGITASDGPGPATRRIHGTTRRFYDYVARRVPYGPDDGTIAPWAATASLPFAPEIVLPALQRIRELYPAIANEYGFSCSFNPTFRNSKTGRAWVSPYHFGLHQGPIVLMLENYFSGLIWRLMRKCPYIMRGLRRAGFHSGWLSG